MTDQEMADKIARERTDDCLKCFCEACGIPVPPGSLTPEGSEDRPLDIGSPAWQWLRQIGPGHRHEVYLFLDALVENLEMVTAGLREGDL